MSDCIFCRIAARELPAQIVHEDERCLAFMDIAPGSRGHLVVIPKAHAADVTDIAPSDLDACNRAAQALTRLALERLGADGATLVSNCGAVSGQTVFHYHLHVIPRYAGVAVPLPWTPQMATPAEIADVAELYRGS